MNNQRRKQIAKIIERFDREVRPILEDIRGDIDALRDEEEEAWDNLPESMQYAEKGDRMQEAIEALDEASNEIDDFDFELITDPLERAAE